MAYSTHPAVETPEDEVVLWRYMDFTKFISLLEESALYFPNVSTLTDPLEGFLTRPVVQRFMHVPEGLSEEVVAKRREIGQHNLATMRMGRELLYVSCWHESSHESMAMWGLYLKNNEGVAIRTTLSKRKEAFAKNPEPVQIGRVKYIDYEEDEIPWDNILYLALHKRKSFEHEREVRALIVSPARGRGGMVPISITALIESVYVAPNAPSWIHDLLKKVVQRYGFNFDVRHSGLEANPLY